MKEREGGAAYHAQIVASTLPMPGGRERGCSPAFCACFFADGENISAYSGSTQLSAFRSDRQKTWRLLHSPPSCCEEILCVSVLTTSNKRREWSKLVVVAHGRDSTAFPEALRGWDSPRWTAHQRGIAGYGLRQRVEQWFSHELGLYKHVEVI